MLHAVIDLVFVILEIAKWLLIATAIFSWLDAFNVINRNNPQLYKIWDLLNRLTEPMLRPVRRFVPSINGVDISFIIALLIIWFAQRLLMSWKVSVPMM